jgi:alpha-L-fucosidase
VPDQAYCQKFYNRTIDLINKYQPDLVYFDDTALPLYPISDAGLKIAAHFYNSNMVQHEGRLEAVLTGKVLTDEQKKCMVWDIERGQSQKIEPLPWQTDTCIGGWHYDRGLFDNHRYKSATTVIHMLADIVSKNGNLLLSIPVRGDGTIDDDERAVVTRIADWMNVNREAIFSTRPWKLCGEGPAMEASAPIQAQGFNEGKGKPFTAEDIRFTCRDQTIYAIVLGWPEKPLNIRSLGKGAANLDRPIAGVTLLGAKEPVKWSQADDGLQVEFPAQKPCDHAYVLKIEPKH